MAGMANGPCATQITAAAGRNVVTHTTDDTPDAATVIDRLGMSDYAVTRSYNILGIAGAGARRSAIFRRR